MSNFAFLHADFRAIAESATLAEGHILGDPRAAVLSRIGPSPESGHGAIDVLFRC